MIISIELTARKAHKMLGDVIMSNAYYIRVYSIDKKLKSGFLKLGFVSKFNSLCSPLFVKSLIKEQITSSK